MKVWLMNKILRCCSARRVSQQIIVAKKHHDIPSSLRSFITCASSPPLNNVFAPNCLLTFCSDEYRPLCRVDLFPPRLLSQVAAPPHVSGRLALVQRRRVQSRPERRACRWRNPPLGDGQWLWLGRLRLFICARRPSAMLRLGLTWQRNVGWWGWRGCWGFAINIQGV